MTPLLLMGWTAAALLVALHLRTRRRLVLVARASHELRGPLCAARLGLHGLAGEQPGRVAAIDLELVRAGRALDDLAAAPSGARGPERAELVDVAALAAAYAPAWRTLAAAHGAAFRLEVSAAVTRVGDAEALATVAALDGAGRDGVVAAPGAPETLPTGAREALAPGVREALAPGAREALAAPPAPGDPFACDPHIAALRVARGDALPATAVFGDPLRLVQACANLVANAAEHGGGVVRVRVRATGGRVRIEVSDDGPGLPGPVAGLAAAARRRQGRRGHGLAITAAIAERHGGRLAAAPTRAGGRVTLELPAAR